MIGGLFMPDGSVQGVCWSISSLLGLGMLPILFINSDLIPFSSCRDQSTHQRMPTRLLELVHKYPFTNGLSPPTTDLQLLPYPQFTTAVYPALLVRVQYEVTSPERIPKKKI